ncbi:hypothetical protein REPUB_Repub06bG0180700 [Reevesia pubescens]
MARKVSLVRAILYIVAQCLGAICGCDPVKAFQKSYYNQYGGGANSLNDGYNTETSLAAEIICTFVLVYTVFSTTDPMRNARDSHVLAPLLIGFDVFMVHLATIPITGTDINHARSFGAAVIYNQDKPWDDHDEEDSWNGVNEAVAGVLVGACVIGVGGIVYQKRKKDNIRAQY